MKHYFEPPPLKGFERVVYPYFEELPSKLYKKTYRTIGLSVDINEIPIIKNGETQFFDKPFAVGYYSITEDFNFDDDCIPEYDTIKDVFTLPRELWNIFTADEVREAVGVKNSEYYNARELALKRLPIYHEDLNRTTNCEILSPEDKKLIVDICGSGQLKRIEQFLKIKLPNEDFSFAYWEYIIYALKSIQIAHQGVSSIPTNSGEGDPKHSRSDGEPQKAEKNTRATPAEMEVRNRKVEAFVFDFINKKTDYPKLKDIEKGTPYTSRQIRQTQFYIQHKDRFNAKAKPKSIVYQDEI